MKRHEVAFLGLFALMTYTPWQLHELAHWIACRVTGVEAVFEFNEWIVLSKASCLALPLAVGPLMNIVFAGMGMVIAYLGRGSRVKLMGLALTLSNTFMEVSTALASSRYALTHLDPCSSEPVWKLILLPIALTFLALAIASFRKVTKLKLLAVAIGIVVAMGLASTYMDRALDACRGTSLCIVVEGIYLPVIIVNAIMFLATGIAVVRFVKAGREQLPLCV